MAGPSLQASTTQISWIYTNCTWSIIILSRTLSCTAVHTHTQAHQSWSRETSQHNGYDLTARRQARWRALQLDTCIVSQPRPFLFHTTDHFQYAASGGRVWRLRTTLHAHSFAKLMFQGKIHTALQLLTDKSKGGILHLHDTINNGESNQITFKGALKCQHPLGQAATLDSIYQGMPLEVNPVIFNPTDASLIWSIALSTRSIRTWFN